MTELHGNGRIFIGMPVYNGEAYLARALDSLLRQSHADWRLLISDNCSTDGTEAIARGYASRDRRISYVRQQANIGAASNFFYLAHACSCEFFMWAAADDEWSEHFIELCIKSLDADSALQFAGAKVVNVDPSGAQLRTIDSFSSFDSSRYRRLFRFLLAPEISGKANMIYSVYRREACQRVCGIPDIFSQWGGDMAFVFASLARGGYRQVPGITLYKRVSTENDIATTKLAAQGRFSQLQFFGCFPPDRYSEYRSAFYRAATDSRLRFLVWLVLACRLLGLRVRLRLLSAHLALAGRTARVGEGGCR